ncbi:hypothetical protein [Polaribacter gochangensis]|uniref:hypothetical protein n=1 Tax=Polaribacter gochangensis TaxID=3252903 RepID=UPI003904DEDB
MKKLIFIFAIVLITSCDKQDRVKFTVTDFSKKRIDTLKPIEGKSYFGSFFKINGFVNDTIRIQPYFGNGLVGEIDTIVRVDYYGGLNVIIEFDPYKATEGKLEIEYNL